jgi:hypothetical protein
MKQAQLNARIARQIDRIQAAIERLSASTYAIAEIVDSLAEAGAEGSSIRRSRGMLAETRLHLRAAAKAVGKA